MKKLNRKEFLYLTVIFFAVLLGSYFDFSADMSAEKIKCEHAGGKFDEKDWRCK